MHLTLKGYCLSVLLIYAITAITSLSPTSSHLTPRDDRSRDLTTRGLTPLAKRGARERLHLHSRQGEQSRNLPHFHYLENRDGTQTKTSEGGPGKTLRPRMAPASADKSYKNRGKPKQFERERMSTSLNRPKEDCSQGEIKPVIYGKFYIIGQLETNTPNVGYQSDTAVSGQERVRGQRLSGSEESWQRLQPVVECGDSAMTLTVRRRRAVQLLLERVNESSVPLSQLPPLCGYSVQATWRDLSLMAQYDACHVTQEVFLERFTTLPVLSCSCPNLFDVLLASINEADEGGSYVLPLLWTGTPVKMSCPASQIQPQAEDPPLPFLCCSPHGMTAKVQGPSATEELRVNVRGEWSPLVMLAEQCGYTLDRQHAEIVIAAPFITCGITVKDGKYTLSLQKGEQTFTLACPVSPPEQLPLTHQPLVDSHHHVTRPTKHVPASLEPFPWAPPFYLAPPYYPHPTYHRADRSGSDDPPASSSTPDPTFGPQPLPPVDSQPDYQDYYSYQIPVRESYKLFGVQSSPADDLEDSSVVYPDLQQKQEIHVLGLSGKHVATHSPATDTGFPIQAEAPPLQPPSHAFNQYYHYYHHPKIPLPDPPQDPDPGPSLTNPHNPEFPVLPPSVPQSEALSRVNSEQIFQPVPEAASHPHRHPTSAPSTPYPPQPYPYHYFSYIPHIARGEAKQSAPINPDSAAKTILSDNQNTKSSVFVHALPHSSEVHDKYSLHPYVDQSSPDVLIKRLLLSDSEGVKAELEPPGPDAVPSPEQPLFPTPLPNHTLPPYPYYHPYYHYYQMHYGPESLLSTDNNLSPTSSKEALNPLLQASSSPPQHPFNGKPQTPPTKSMDDIHHGPLHPYYYYYHLYYQPEVSVDNQEVHPAGSMDSKSESQLPSDSDYSRMGWLVHAAEAGHPSMLQSNPFHSIYSHDIVQQHSYDPFGHADEEQAGERLADEMEDHLSASPDTPWACGLGLVSDFHCSVSSGCCLYPAKDCTEGQHLIFAVPDSVLGPAVDPLAHPSEVSNVSCTLQRLTSDPDIYIVPLEGCGVNKHVFGQTAVHLLDVHGIQSLEQHHTSVHENAVRLMVQCSSPGEVRLHVIDQLPPPPVQSTPAMVTVQLRIATDESFTSFHPEAHLPLSVMRGRPVYVEVSLLDPPEPSLVLLVHSCLAYTQAPSTSWTLVYDGCPSRGDSQRLPSPHSDHIQRIMISSFLLLPSENLTFLANSGQSHLEDPEIFFLCLTEVCSAANGDCTVGCIDSADSDV